MCKILVYVSKPLARIELKSIGRGFPTSVFVGGLLVVCSDLSCEEKGGQLKKTSWSCWSSISDVNLLFARQIVCTILEHKPQCRCGNEKHFHRHVRIYSTQLFGLKAVELSEKV